MFSGEFRIPYDDAVRSPRKRARATSSASTGAAVGFVLYLSAGRPRRRSAPRLPVTHPVCHTPGSRPLLPRLAPVRPSSPLPFLERSYKRGRPGELLQPSPGTGGSGTASALRLIGRPSAQPVRTYLDNRIGPRRAATRRARPAPPAPRADSTRSPAATIPCRSTARKPVQSFQACLPAWPRATTVAGRAARTTVRVTMPRRPSSGSAVVERHRRPEPRTTWPGQVLLRSGSFRRGPVAPVAIGPVRPSSKSARCTVRAPAQRNDPRRLPDPVPSHQPAGCQQTARLPIPDSGAFRPCRRPTTGSAPFLGPPTDEGIDRPPIPTR